MAAAWRMPLRKYSTRTFSFGAWILSSGKATPEDAATTLWVSLSVINCLKTALYPFLPFSSEKLHLMLGLEGSIQDNAWTWDSDQIQPNVLLPKPTPLFTKLDASVVEQETQLMG